MPMFMPILNSRYDGQPTKGTTDKVISPSSHSWLHAMSSKKAADVVWGYIAAIGDVFNAQARFVEIRDWFNSQRACSSSHVPIIRGAEMDIS